MDNDDGDDTSMDTTTTSTNTDSTKSKAVSIDRGDDQVDDTMTIVENGKHQVNGTVPHMIHQQMSTNIEDPGEGFIDVVLTCFCYWISPENFAKSVVDVYECEKSDMLRLSLALVIRR